MFTGPNMTNDGLVFYYDTGNTRKSFRGEPTVNLILNPIPINGNNYEFTSIVYESNGVDQYMRWNISSYATWGAYAFNNSLATYVFDTMNLYTASFKWKFGPEHNSNANISFQIINGNGSESVTNSSIITESTSGSDGWNYFTWTFTPTNDGTIGSKQFRLITSDATGYTTDIMWKELQLEKKPHPTPFSPSSRSATESLLDLTGNNTIDVSNAGFDTDGLIFDGIDDVAKISPFSGFNGQSEASFEFWIQRDSTLSHGHVIWSNPSILVEYLTGDVLRVRWYQDVVNGYGTEFRISNLIYSTTEHIVLTYNFGQIQMFFQGNLITSGTDQGTTLTGVPTEIDLCFRATVDAIAAKLPILKIYNKALTPLQVKQNFNAFKSRFGIL